MCPHPVGVSFQRPQHRNEQRLLQQSKHSADHGLEACQGAKVVGRVTVGESQGGYPKFDTPSKILTVFTVLKLNDPFI